ncbi:MAG: hypothetical protein R3F22_08670 [Lysobacteraceae bacterium]
MRILIVVTLLASLVASHPSHAAVIWVGSSPACTGASVPASLDQALFVAAFNGDTSDEIRLTRTVNYTGNDDGSYVLDNWTASGGGALTLVGGYSDCFTAPSGRTTIGDTATTIFDIGVTSEASSEVTLRNLLLDNSDQYAVVASAGAVVMMENVAVTNSNGGIQVGANAYVEIDADSRINFNNSGASDGGGIRCSGSNSSAVVAGQLQGNHAHVNGGNIYVGSGCFVELSDGARIQGSPSGPIEAVHGGGVYVAGNGQLHARGRANRVILHDLWSWDGAGLYVDGGLAILENVHFDNNSGSEPGAAIVVNNGGQLFMDRTADCPLGGLRCSEIQNTGHIGSVVLVQGAGSLARIQRTLIERSVYGPVETLVAHGLITGSEGATVRLHRVGIIDNEMYAGIGYGDISASGASFEISHLTMAGNQYPESGNSFSFVNRRNDASLRIENSVLTDTRGSDWYSGSFSGKCNLIDTADGRFGGTVWPTGSYSIGTPDFVNIAGNDPHQLPSSDGVDMCNADSFTWTNAVDIDMQSAPVNESTNPQGTPGEIGGLYDAGFDEVYANVGEDEFTLSVEKIGSGDGVVISNPAGISCGADCSQVYFNGTLVTLNAAATTGSAFVDWLNCPLVNDADQCLIAMTTSHTVRAEFESLSGPELFSDGFE